IMRLSEITHADRCRIRLRTESPQSDPYRGIPPKPAQPARQTKTGIQAAQPPQPPQPPPRPVPPTSPEPPEPPQPKQVGGEPKPPKQPKQAKPEIKTLFQNPESTRSSCSIRFAQIRHAANSWKAWKC